MFEVEFLIQSSYHIPSSSSLLLATELANAVKNYLDHGITETLTEEECSANLSENLGLKKAQES